MLSLPVDAKIFDGCGTHPYFNGRGTSNQKRNVGCFNSGHFARHCLNRIDNENNASGGNTRSSIPIAVAPDCFPGAPAESLQNRFVVGSRTAYLPVKFDGKLHWCVLDSGGEVSVVPAKHVQLKDVCWFTF